MRFARLSSAAFAAAALVLVLAKCAEPPVAPAVAAPAFSVAAYTAQEGSPLSCPERAAKSFSVTLDQRGAQFSKFGVEVVIPAGAIPGPQRFDVTIPRSRFVEADIHAVGYDHYRFAKPITVTFDYARCGQVVATAPALDVWYVDGASRQLLEAMPTSDDRSDKRITFQTTHLSGYQIAWRTNPNGSGADTSASNQ
jgi:hypothetical protein